jgi:DNA-binding response OmpR family regulator
MMPKVDGFTTCKEIRKFCSTPVIMLSARGEEYDKLFGFELGVDDYIVKPFFAKGAYGARVRRARARESKCRQARGARIWRPCD